MILAGARAVCCDDGSTLRPHLLSDDIRDMSCCMMFLDKSAESVPNQCLMHMLRSVAKTVKNAKGTLWVHWAQTSPFIKHCLMTLPVDSVTVMIGLWEDLGYIINGDIESRIGEWTSRDCEMARCIMQTHCITGKVRNEMHRLAAMAAIVGASVAIEDETHKKTVAHKKKEERSRKKRDVSRPSSQAASATRPDSGWPT